MQGATLRGVVPLTIHETWHGRVVVVSAEGSIDLLTAPDLYSAAASAAKREPAGFVFDFGAVDLLASAGMHVLVTTRRMLGPDVGFAVVADGPGTSRPLQIAGITEFIDVVPALDDALAKVGNGPACSESV